jgi:outer membrane receptor protein involved in Fe transport
MFAPRAWKALLAGGVCALAISGVAVAQSRTFNVPAGDLKSALDVYIRQSGVQLIYPSDGVRGKTTPGVNGAFSSAAALDRLLAGSGLAATRDPSGAVVVALAPRGLGGGDAPALQRRPPEPIAPSLVQEVVATASRTARDGLQAPTPTQILSSEAIDRQAAATIMEVLNQNAAFKAARTPNANATNLSSPGQATADLRGLGGQRTLVLVNGSRIVPFAPAVNQSTPITTDLNLMPTMMVDHIDVVTGGGSALYGSDAVSGVVNVVMKQRFKGLDARIQAGVSERQDDHHLRAGFLAGTDFSESRGAVVVSADYSKEDGISTHLTRDWARKNPLIVTDRGGATNLLLTDNVVNSLGAGGVIVAGPAALVGKAFNPDGSLRPFRYGSPIDGRVMVGGEGLSVNALASLVPSVERITTYGSVYYDVSETLTAYAEGGWSRASGDLDSATLRVSSQLIRNDNAFIPASVRAVLPAGANFSISRIGFDMGPNHFHVVNETAHGTVGLKGKLGAGWSWDAHSSYGENRYTQRGLGQLIVANQNFAIDAVVNPANGQIVCRATLPGPSFNPAAAGCAPLNLFGEGNTSQAARDYFRGDSAAAVTYSQFTYAANLVGDLLDLPAGPLRVALGGEYRRETYRLSADAIGAANGYVGAGNAVPYAGDFNVREAYVEATAPVVEGFEVNGAVRYADYSTAGGQTAWKAGAVYTPIDGLNLRVSRSRDIRAPAINELYSPGAMVTNPLTLKVDGISKTAIIPQNSSAGNPNVRPELADTWTIGFTYRGGGALAGFSTSADYYKITIKDAITNPGATQVAALCEAGVEQYCEAFTYGPDPAAPGQRIHTAYLSGTLNLGSVKQEGLDVTVRYRAGAPFLGEQGRYTASASAAYVFHSIVDPGTVGSMPLDYAGVLGPTGLAAVPRFRAELSQSIGTERWEATLQTLYIGSGIQDVAYNNPSVPGSQTINDNSVPATWYFNLYGRVFVGRAKTYEMFWAINNLLDQDPRVTPQFALNAPVNGVYYDKIGRRYTAGLRVRF